MGYVNGNDRDARLQELLGDGGRNRLIGLELDCQIDLLANEMVGIAQRYFRIITIIDDNQFHVQGICGSQ